jgi:protein involved in polysaccharide export with SLBB domain
MRHVLLKRSGKVIADFDLYALLVNGDKTGDLQLQPGDVLYIPPVGPQVGLLGSVGKPAIYELRGNQSVDTLLATAGGRTAIATGARISVERIVDHEHRQAFELATDPAGLAAPLNNGDIVRVDSIVSDYRDTVTLRGAVANPGHFRWHEGMRLSELMPDRDSLLKRDYWWRRTQLGLPAPEFITLAAPTTSAAGPTSLESIAPTALAGGSKQLPVESPVGQTNWNYAVIERLDPATMTSSLIPFAPGKLVLEHDASQDHQLMPGDVVTIFSQSEIQIPIREQTKYITLEGEFVHPGVYSEVPGETLRSLVQRAGGFTPQAYLYAAVFTRRSTQAVEQQHLNEFADQLERELLHSSTVNSPPGAAVQQAQQAQQQNRELLSHIRGARASGRIVLDLHQRADGDYDLPDMQLEDGDRFIVPYTPQTVQVLGAVFNPNSFLFQSHANEQQFLHLAGGPNREADRRRIYVLRADGSVAGRLSNSTIFSQSIGNIRLHPGDSIVVPEKSLHASVFNQALGWAQTISQSSLTAMEAAAITTQ